MLGLVGSAISCVYHAFADCCKKNTTRKIIEICGGEANFSPDSKISKFVNAQLNEEASNPRLFATGYVGGISDIEMKTWGTSMACGTTFDHRPFVAVFAGDGVSPPSVYAAFQRHQNNPNEWACDPSTGPFFMNHVNKSASPPDLPEQLSALIHGKHPAYRLVEPKKEQ